MAGLVGLAGCDDGGGIPPRPVTHPKDDALRLNHLQAEGTHNSYHVETTDGAVVEWNYTHAPLAEQLDSQGVRKLELDVHWEFRSEQHAVFHVVTVDEGTVCDTVVECLEDVKRWSDFHPGHHPLFIMIEPKDQDGGDYPLVTSRLEGLEEEIRSVLPDDRLITPELVRGSSATLVEAIDGQGWPTLGEVRGRILFFLDCKREMCVEYANQGSGLDGQLLFAASQPGDPWEAVRVINDPEGSGAEITAAVEAGRIVRTMVDGVDRALDGTTRLDEGLASGAHLLSTDVPVPRDDTDYFVEIPGGTPSRCNPVSAPDDCTSTDIEDPSLLEGP